jgi:hypothetical protein
MIRDSEDGWEWELRNDGENKAIGFLVRRVKESGSET